jgi:hypothetical protein
VNVVFAMSSVMMLDVEDPARHPELSIIKCSGRELTNRSFACGVAVLSPLSDS